MRAAPYLQFDGDCAAAFAFYGTCFGSSPEIYLTYGQSPMAAQVPAAHHDRIMHAEIAVGESKVMGADVMGPYTPNAGFHITIGTDSIEEAERVFAALSQGGVIGMPLQETFWTPRFGTLTDKFGKPWMVNYQMPP